jgi:hypothetical protein
MQLTGTTEQQLIHLNMHWGRLYVFAAPDTEGTWTAAAKFGGHDQLQADSATEMLLAVRRHYSANKLPERVSGAGHHLVIRKANVMSATLTLGPEQRELLAQALADAVHYRDPPADCQACKELNDETKLCPECAVTFALASSYLDLGSNLGVSIPE